jgi:hypothetical protein
MYRRRRRSLALLAGLMLVAVLAVRGFGREDDPGRPVATGASARPASAAPPSAPPSTAALLRPQVLAATRPPTSAAAPPPLRTTGRFSYVGTRGPVMGTGGGVHLFKVAVERGAGISPAAFAATVDRILGDPRGWIASGRTRFERVPPGAGRAFTIMLASAATSQRICLAGGLHTDGYTSCRLPGRVVINADRWRTAIPGYGAPLATYQTYAINHEVGHELGYGHEACPGPGQPAPVMQQQTYGLKGCLPNPWPYVDGRRYAGPPVA